MMENKEDSESTVLKIYNPDEEFIRLIKENNSQDLARVKFMFGEHQHLRKNDENSIQPNIFRLDRIIKDDRKKRTALRILIEDSGTGLELALAALHNAKQQNCVMSLDDDTKDQLIKDIALLICPKEKFYITWSSKSVEDLKRIGENPMIKQITGDSFDLQLFKKIQKSKEKGHKELEGFLLQPGVYLGKIVYLKYDQNEDKSRITKDGRTLFRIILEDVINGHKLVMVMLNNLVDSGSSTRSDDSKTTCPKCLDTNEQDAFIKLNLHPLYTEGDQIKLVYDLLDIQSQRGFADNFREIFDHPIIRTYILTKWDRINWSFYFRVRLFALFVFLFTAFIRIRIVEFSTGLGLYTGFAACYYGECAKNQTWINGECGRNETWINGIIFNNNHKNVVVVSIILSVVGIWQVFGLLWQIYILYHTWKKGEKDGNKDDEEQELDIHTYIYRKRTTALFLGCLNTVCLIVGIASCMHSCLLSIVLLLIWIYLLARELMQFGALVIHPVWHGQGTWVDFFKQLFKMHYWNDPENYIEIIILVCLPIALFCEITGTEVNAEVLRGIVAAGICCAWVELIFMLGMPSTSYLGDFITMFYNVLKIKLWSYMKIFFLLTTGFGFAFWTLDAGDEPKPNFNDTYGSFESLNFQGFWLSQILSIAKSAGELNVADVYKNFQEQSISLMFAMVFLVLLIIFSSIAMLNLLVAAIISDYQEMESEVDHQSMNFMAEYAINSAIYRDIMLKTPFYRLATILNERARVPDNLKYCAHEMCNKKQINMKKYESSCTRMPLPMIRSENERMSTTGGGRKPQAILQNLIAIRNSNLDNEEEEGQYCKYHRTKSFME